MTTWEQERLNEEAQRQAGLTLEEFVAEQRDPDPRVEAMARSLYEDEKAATHPGRRPFL